MSVKITPVASAKINLTKPIIRECELCTSEHVHETTLSARRLARFGHTTPTEMPGHRFGLGDNDPVSLNSALLLQRLIDRSSRRS